MKGNTPKKILRGFKENSVPSTTEVIVGELKRESTFESSTVFYMSIFLK